MKRPMVPQILLSLGVWVAGASAANAYIEFNAFYMSDALTTDTSASATKMFIEGAVGFEIDKKGYYLVGWNYSMFSTTDQATETTTYSSTQMGPRFLFMLDKAKTWSFGFAYNLVTKATYQAAGGTAETWKGTGIKADIGYNFIINDNFKLGLRMNYSTSSYVEKLVGDTTYSTISYTKALMYPSVYTMISF